MKFLKYKAFMISLMLIIFPVLAGASDCKAILEKAAIPVLFYRYETNPSAFGMYLPKREWAERNIVMETVLSASIDSALFSSQDKLVFKFKPNSKSQDRINRSQYGSIHTIYLGKEVPLYSLKVFITGQLPKERVLIGGKGVRERDARESDRPKYFLEFSFGSKGRLLPSDHTHDILARFGRKIKSAKYQIIEGHDGLPELIWKVKLKN